MMNYEPEMQVVAKVGEEEEDVGVQAYTHKGKSHAIPKRPQRSPQCHKVELRLLNEIIQRRLF